MTRGPLAITGATGFVGQMVLDVATAREVPVRALARSAQRPRAGVEWVAGSLADDTALATLCADAEAVLHIAGLTNTPDPAQFHAANVTGTQALVAACKHASVKRFVFVSSLAARMPDLSAYGASKAAAERVVSESGLSWTKVRPPAVFGPRDRDMFELFRAARLGIVPLPPGGATSLIHVGDLARLLLDLADTNTMRHRLFEPDDGREGGWSHRELAVAIGAAMDRKVFAPALPESVLQLAARLDRAFRGTGARLTADRVNYMCHPNWVARSDRAVPQHIWRPQIDTGVGLADTAQWYRREGWL